MSKQITLVSWNVRGGGRHVQQQCEYLSQTDADIVTLQDVTVNSLSSSKSHLRNCGWPYVEDSTAYVEDTSVLVKARKSTVVLASRWPFSRLPHQLGPWPERLLSVIIASPFGEIEVHSAYIPPGVSNGWVKIETLEAVYREIAHDSTTGRILCGDFNTPQFETVNGEVITGAQRVSAQGEVKLKKSHGERWDTGERNVLQGLADYDVKDVYRQLYGYGIQEYSWYWTGRGKKIGRRFDHVFASADLNPSQIVYLHAAREIGLSDHSPVLCKFDF